MKQYDAFVWSRAGRRSMIDQVSGGDGSGPAAPARLAVTACSTPPAGRAFVAPKTCRARLTRPRVAAVARDPAGAAALSTDSCAARAGSGVRADVKAER
jgi:hypothetical protein